MMTTLTSTLFFTLHYLASYLQPWHFIFVHLIWILNHSVNPLFYLVFNKDFRDRVMGKTPAAVATANQKPTNRRASKPWERQSGCRRGSEPTRKQDHHEMLDVEHLEEVVGHVG